MTLGRYSRKRYWIMVMLGSGLLLGVTAGNILMLTVTFRAARREMAQNVRSMVIAAYQQEVQSTRRELELLSMATIDRLTLLQFSDGALQNWIDTTVDRFMAAHPQVVDVAIYNIDLQRVRQARQSVNFPPRAGADGFCLDGGQLAYRVTVQAFSANYVPRGALSAILVFPPEWFQRYERQLGLLTQVTAMSTLYRHPVTPVVSCPPQLRIFPSRQRELQPLAAVRWADWRLWFVYRAEVGNVSPLASVLFFRPADRLFWAIVQTVSVTILMGLSLAGLLTFFDVNYKRISQTYRAIYDNIQDWILYQDAPDAVRYVNAACAADLFHAPPKTVIAQARVISDEMMRTAAQQAWQSGQRQTFDLCHDGRRLAGVVTPIISAHAVIGVVTTVRDFTELFAAQHDVTTWRSSAMTAQSVLQAIFDALPDWVCVVDDDGKFVMVGEAMATAMQTQAVDVREILDAASPQVVWTLSSGASYLTTKVRVHADPPQWLLLARNVTELTTQHELIERIIALTTAHLRELTRSRKSALILQQS